MYFLLTMCQKYHYKYKKYYIILSFCHWRQKLNSKSYVTLLYICQKTQESHETGHLEEYRCLFFKKMKSSTDKLHLNIILISFLFLTLSELLAIFISSIIFCATITITGLFLPLSFVCLMKVRVTGLLVSPFVRAGSSL